MATFRFTFETTEDGRTRGIEIENSCYALATEEACRRLRALRRNVETVKIRQLKGDTWVTIFDPFRGKV